MKKDFLDKFGEFYYYNSDILLPFGLIFLIVISSGIFCINFKKNYQPKTEEKYIGFKIENVKSVLYSNDKDLKHYVFLIDENKQSYTYDDVELYEQCKEHIGEDIYIRFSENYKFNKKDLKKCFVTQKIIHPLDFYIIKNNNPEIDIIPSDIEVIEVRNNIYPFFIR